MTPTVARTFAPLHTTCGTTTATPHVYACEIDLAQHYLRHNKLIVAMECAWAAFDTARALGLPAATYEASCMLSCIAIAMESDPVDAYSAADLAWFRSHVGAL